MAHAGLDFGIFIQPMHRLGDNPTVALARDLDLIEWVDKLGYDEAWVGEHYSGGWENIAAPDMMLAAAGQRTRRIRLGTGVTSLSYHHPFVVANRLAQLDHMTEGRAMLGCGPGAMNSDAYMMGIDTMVLRTRMDQALGAIMQLLRSDEPVNVKTDWFELKDARLHMSPYTAPHLPVAVASLTTPSGVSIAGKHGVGVLSIGASLPEGPAALGKQWEIAEQHAEKHGQSVNRKDWRLVVNAYAAEDEEEAVRDVMKGEALESLVYSNGTLGRPVRSDIDRVAAGIASGNLLVGTPDTIIKGIERMIAYTNGGCGCILFREHEWTNRHKAFQSFELIARYVIPHFQKSVAKLTESADWVRANRKEIFGTNKAAFEKAYADAGQAMPDRVFARPTGD